MASGWPPPDHDRDWSNGNGGGQLASPVLLLTGRQFVREVP